MNTLRKQAAVTKFGALIEKGLTAEEIKEQITADEKDYPENEVQEILEALFPVGDKGSTAPPPPPAPNEEGDTTTEAPIRYEKWNCQIKIDENGKRSFEKLKLVKKGIKISETQAEILNDGVLHGGNNYAPAYFLPE